MFLQNALFVFAKFLHNLLVRKPSQGLNQTKIGMAKLTPSLVFRFTAEQMKLAVMVRGVISRTHYKCLPTTTH